MFKFKFRVRRFFCRRFLCVFVFIVVCVKMMEFKCGFDVDEVLFVDWFGGMCMIFDSDVAVVILRVDI